MQLRDGRCATAEARKLVAVPAIRRNAKALWIREHVLQQLALLLQVTSENSRCTYHSW